MAYLFVAALTVTWIRRLDDEFVCRIRQGPILQLTSPGKNSSLQWVEAVPARFALPTELIAAPRAGRGTSRRQYEQLHSAMNTLLSCPAMEVFRWPRISRWQANGKSKSWFILFFAVTDLPNSCNVSVNPGLISGFQFWHISLMWT
jgi:hypothetical protein